MRGARGAARCRRLAAGFLALVLATLLAGCSYADDEPGLFGRTPASSVATEDSGQTPDSTAPVPVLGEATWISVDPPGIPIRIAIHGVRRVPGGTVLDWSITALSAAGGRPGAPIPGGLRLDLDEPSDVALVDAPADRVYRPLLSRDGSRQCLCTPARRAQEDLALDVPRLLQVAYPPLPESARVIDVSITPVPVFSRIPVAPIGAIAAPIAETDLARPITPAAPLGRTADFRLPNGQGFAIEVEAVLASGTLTSVVWSLEARSRGPGPGPGLQPQLTRGDTWRVTPLRLRRTGDAPACLCLDPAVWREQLEEPGRRVTVVTNLGEIPRGTTAVDVLFPGVPPLRDIRVTAASDGAYRSGGTTRGPRQTWSYRANRAQPGWRLYNWPTPAPKITADDFAATVDRLLS
ncbi:MAG TPA: hypothetical protein VK401_03505 [Propionibacteriaceae bacterium]|jgi:hypothetical protein|nr:hypothetical protein [Propionibacteriaceae bacterium]